MNTHTHTEYIRVYLWKRCSIVINLSMSYCGNSIAQWSKIQDAAKHGRGHVTCRPQLCQYNIDAFQEQITATLSTCCTDQSNLVYYSKSLVSFQIRYAVPVNLFFQYIIIRVRQVKLCLRV